MDLTLVPYIPSSPANPKLDTAIYRECLKNHAAAMGGQSFDGCGEFMPNFKDKTLNCAACGCHRNFHRQEIFPHKPPLLIPSPVPVSFFPPARGQEGLIRKRFRTKFTAEQKEKMRMFAEKIGWRVEKQDCEALDKFCMQIGVKRHVLKVWMNNHKTNFSSPAGGESRAAAPPSIPV